MNNDNKTTLWLLLEKHEVVIPIIQRDYAQGRKDKSDLRHRFLKSLKDALDNSNEIKLDFVYGGIKNNQMAPLDGQQRLTTLWLLHWFIAFRAGELKNAEVRELLKRFYYATRPSSTEFCRRLVDEFGKAESKDVTKIVGYIKDRHWYYSFYNNDPTIQAMLTMIEGTGSEESDGLEQFFEGECNYREYWKKLTTADSPIQFYHQEMIGNNIPLVDDLYIKMNARGKQLTHFENFKAELIGYWQEKGMLNIEDNTCDREFVSNLDNSWVNIFWPYKHKVHNRVDEIYFKFLSQFMLSFYLINSNNADIDKTSLYRRLMEGKEFHKIEDYEEILNNEKFKATLFCSLNGIAKCSKDINSFLKNILDCDYYLQFEFIPQYTDKIDECNDQDNQPTTTLKHIPQVIFFAICKFFEKWNATSNEEWNDETSQKLQDWVRFCHNITHNPIVDSPSTMQRTLRLINELSEKSATEKSFCLDIYGSLYKYASFNELQETIKSDTASEQLEEEYYKAKYQTDIDKDSKSNLKESYINAEKHAFFKGCIRFLLWDENGTYINNEEEFNSKFHKAKNEYFTKDDTFDGKIYNKDCFCNYFCSCTKIEDIISSDNYGNDCIRFNNSGEAWKIMLTNKSLSLATHNFLTGNIAKKEELKERFKDTDEETMKRMGYITETVLEKDFMKALEGLGDIVKNMLFLRKSYNWALYPLRASMPRKVILLGTSRNHVLKELSDKDNIETDNRVGESSMFYGWDIPFTYRGHKFEWINNSGFYGIKYNVGSEQQFKEIAYDCDYNNVKSILDNGIKNINASNTLN